MVQKNLSSLVILLIDDEPVSLKYSSRILNQIGIGDIVTAENGVEALDILRAKGTAFDVVICDIEMPEMDGFEFVRRIRYGTVPKFKDIPIFMLTGRDTDDNAQRARFHKINGFIVKPATKDDLIIKLSQVLEI